MSAYLNSLAKEVTDTSPPVSPLADLQARLQRWFEGLPEFTRCRPFSMQEVEVALKEPGRLISPALLALGWTRKRRWASRRHYHRYWIPPCGL